MEGKMNQNNLFDTSMNRRDALKTMGKAAMAGAMLSTVPGMGEAALSNSDDRPNIIYILGDNHNADTMEFCGHPFIKTPGLNRLAKEGVHMVNTFNTTSLLFPMALTALYFILIYDGGYAFHLKVKMVYRALFL